MSRGERGGMGSKVSSKVRSLVGSLGGIPPWWSHSPSFFGFFASAANRLKPSELLVPLIMSAKSANSIVCQHGVKHMWSNSIAQQHVVQCQHVVNDSMWSNVSCGKAS